MKLDQSQFKAGQTFVLAVSGGVDSMALLDRLATDPDLDDCSWIVAHFDHGIRSQSASDQQFVKEAADRYGLEFDSQQGKLGSDASEATAREARYAFLKSVAAKHEAAIVTAHHQDDVIETMIINMLRGTNRRGLSSLRSTDELIRPLLQASKQDLVDYCHNKQLDWREDHLNQDTKFLRNYIRKNITSKMTAEQRQQFLEINLHSSRLNDTIEVELERLQQALVEEVHTGKKLDKYSFIMLPKSVALEVLKNSIQQSGQTHVSAQALRSAWLFCKTAKTGKSYDLASNLKIRLADNEIFFDSTSP